MYDPKNALWEGTRYRDVREHWLICIYGFVSNAAIQIKIVEESTQHKSKYYAHMHEIMHQRNDRQNSKYMLDNELY